MYLDRHPDVLVIGAGIVGAAVAREAAAAGLTTTVISADAPGSPVTATGMGHIVVLDDDAAELALSAYSSTLWEKWRAEPAAEFSQCGTLWVAGNDDEAAMLQPKALRLRAAGVAATVIDGRDICRFEPNLAGGLSGALRVAQDAVVYAPRVAARLLGSANGEQPITLITDTVTRITPSGVMLAKGGALVAGAVVVAAGLGARQLLPELTLVPRKGHLIITDRYPGHVNHQVLELGYSASAHGVAESVAFNLQPRPTGQLMIGSSRQPGVESREMDATVVAKMMTRALQFMPNLANLTALRVWTGVRPGTVDGLPFIGPWPPIARCWLAAGHEGLGITTALGTACLIIDQILQRKSAIDPAPYSPLRLFPTAALRLT